MGFSADAFIVIVLACVSSTVLSHHLLGTTLSLSLPYLDLSGDAQLGWVALLGAVGGGRRYRLHASSLRHPRRLTRAWQRLGVPIWARPGIGGLAVGATLLVLPEMYGESSAALNRALAGRYALTLLLVLCVAKMLATSLTLGMGFVGGVFAPVPVHRWDARCRLRHPRGSQLRTGRRGLRGPSAWGRSSPVRLAPR